jgi:hypothetical protein
MVSVEETRQFERERDTGVLAGRRPASVAARKKTLLWLGIGGGIVALVLLLALGLSLFGGGGSEQHKGREVAQAGQKKGKTTDAARPANEQVETYLLIQWPEPERRDAKLEIDGRPVELAGGDIDSDQGHLRIPTEAGSHRIWIARRGFAPYEVQVAVSEGQSLEITPEWNAAPGLVGETEPGPEQAAAKPEPKSTTPEPSQMAQEPRPSQREPEPPKREAPELDPEEEKRLAAEQRYTEALAPAEEMIAAWKFREALAELGKLQFEEQDFATRLASRREQVKQLAQLKRRIIDKLNKAEPRVTKADLKIRGFGGDIVKADEEGITAQLRTKTETRPWNDLGQQATEPLLGLVIDPQKPEDLLAAGLLAMACKNTGLAEGYFDQARQLGVDIGPYLGPLAQTAFSRARKLLDKGQFAEAAALLTNVEAEYSDILWFGTNRSALTAAQAEAKRAIYEAEAEKLYQEAAELFRKEQLFDVKPLVEKLKSDYVNSQPVTDAGRQPSFAEMEKAVADLGQFISVRQDGEGDFTSIQAAIDAAAPNSLIEIQDNGPYNEKVNIPQEGLVLRGATECWPIITSVGRLTGFSELVVGAAPGTTIERLILVHGGGAGAEQTLLSGDVCLRFSILWAPHPAKLRGTLDLQTCAIAAPTYGPGQRIFPIVARDCMWLADCPHAGVSLTCTNVVFCDIPQNLAPGPRSVFRSCTLYGLVKVDEPDVRLIRCILPSVQSSRSDTVIEFCNVYGKVPFIDEAQPGKGCFSADPQFVNPANLDYRLRPTSPCIGKASDGGDIGCRYTPGMIEIIQKALELRAKGIIKF